MSLSTIRKYLTDGFTPEAVLIDTLRGSEGWSERKVKLNLSRAVNAKAIELTEDGYRDTGLPLNKLPKKTAVKKAAKRRVRSNGQGPARMSVRKAVKEGKTTIVFDEYWNTPVPELIERLKAAEGKAAALEAKLEKLRALLCQ